MPTAPDRFRAPGSKTVEQRKAEADARRPSASKRGYGKGWAQIRRTVIHRDGYHCKLCGSIVALHKRDEIGDIKVAHVDHVDGNSHNRAWNNLRCLCETCHNKRTARDQAFGRAEPGWRR